MSKRKLRVRVQIAICVFEDCHAHWHRRCPRETEIDGVLHFCGCVCHKKRRSRRKTK